MVSCQPGITPPDGGYTNKDVEAMEMLGKLYKDSDAYALLLWLLQDATLDEIQNRLPKILEGVMQGWGLMRMDGTRRPAVEALKTAFASV